MSEEKPLTADEIRESLSTPDPVLEAMAMMMKELASETVSALQAIMAMVGADPATLPGEFLLQAVLIEADKVFVPISREAWIGIYDGYQEVKAVLEANPGLKEEIQANLSHDHDHSLDGLLDGKF